METVLNGSLVSRCNDLAGKWQQMKNGITPETAAYLEKQAGEQGDGREDLLVSTFYSAIATLGPKREAHRRPAFLEAFAACSVAVTDGQVTAIEDLILSPEALAVLRQATGGDVSGNHGAAVEVLKTETQQLRAELAAERLLRAELEQTSGEEVDELKQRLLELGAQDGTLNLEQHSRLRTQLQIMHTELTRQANAAPTSAVWLGLVTWCNSALAILSPTKPSVANPALAGR